MYLYRKLTVTHTSHTWCENESLPTKWEIALRPFSFALCRFFCGSARSFDWHALCVVHMQQRQRYLLFDVETSERLTVAHSASDKMAKRKSNPSEMNAECLDVRLADVPDFIYIFFRRVSLAHLYSARASRSALNAKYNFGTVFSSFISRSQCDNECARPNVQFFCSERVTPFQWIQTFICFLHFISHLHLLFIYFIYFFSLLLSHAIRSRSSHDTPNIE